MKQEDKIVIRFCYPGITTNGADLKLTEAKHANQLWQANLGEIIAEHLSGREPFRFWAITFDQGVPVKFKRVSVKGIIDRGDAADFLKSGAVITREMVLEYGRDQLELMAGAIQRLMRVIDPDNRLLNSNTPLSAYPVGLATGTCEPLNGTVGLRRKIAYSSDLLMIRFMTDVKFVNRCTTSPGLLQMLMSDRYGNAEKYFGALSRIFEFLWWGNEARVWQNASGDSVFSQMFMGKFIPGCYQIFSKLMKLSMPQLHPDAAILKLGEVNEQEIKNRLLSLPKSEENIWPDLMFADPSLWHKGEQRWVLLANRVSEIRSALTKLDISDQDVAGQPYPYSVALTAESFRTGSNRLNALITAIENALVAIEQYLVAARSNNSSRLVELLRRVKPDECYDTGHPVTLRLKYGIGVWALNQMNVLDEMLTLIETQLKIGEFPVGLIMLNDLAQTGEFNDSDTRIVITPWRGGVPGLERSDSALLNRFQIRGVHQEDLLINDINRVLGKALLGVGDNFILTRPSVYGQLRLANLKRCVTAPDAPPDFVELYNMGITTALVLENGAHAGYIGKDLDHPISEAQGFARKLARFSDLVNRYPQLQYIRYSEYKNQEYDLLTRLTLPLTGEPDTDMKLVATHRASRLETLYHRPEKLSHPAAILLMMARDSARSGFFAPWNMFDFHTSEYDIDVKYDAARDEYVLTNELSLSTVTAMLANFYVGNTSGLVDHVSTKNLPLWKMLVKPNTTDVWGKIKIESTHDQLVEVIVSNNDQWLQGSKAYGTAFEEIRPGVYRTPQGNILHLVLETEALFAKNAYDPVYRYVAKLLPALCFMRCFRHQKSVTVKMVNGAAPGTPAYQSALTQYDDPDVLYQMLIEEFGLERARYELKYRGRQMLNDTFNGMGQVARIPLSRITSEKLTVTWILENLLKPIPGVFLTGTNLENLAQDILRGKDPETSDPVDTIHWVDRFVDRMLKLVSSGALPINDFSMTTIPSSLEVMLDTYQLPRFLRPEDQLIIHSPVMLLPLRELEHSWFDRYTEIVRDKTETNWFALYTGQTLRSIINQIKAMYQYFEATPGPNPMLFEKCCSPIEADVLPVGGNIRLTGENPESKYPEKARYFRKWLVELTAWPREIWPPTHFKVSMEGVAALWMIRLAAINAVVAIDSNLGPELFENIPNYQHLEHLSDTKTFEQFFGEFAAMLIDWYDFSNLGEELLVPQETPTDAVGMITNWLSVQPISETIKKESEIMEKSESVSPDEYTEPAQMSDKLSNADNQLQRSAAPVPLSVITADLSPKKNPGLLFQWDSFDAAPALILGMVVKIDQKSIPRILGMVAPVMAKYGGLRIQAVPMGESGVLLKPALREPDTDSLQEYTSAFAETRRLFKQNKIRWIEMVRSGVCIIRDTGIDPYTPRAEESRALHPSRRSEALMAFRGKLCRRATAGWDAEDHEGNQAFLEKWVGEKQHNSLIESDILEIMFVAPRDITDELLRHRHASPAHTSTRTIPVTSSIGISVWPEHLKAFWSLGYDDTRDAAELKPVRDHLFRKIWTAFNAQENIIADEKAGMVRDATRSLLIFGHMAAFTTSMNLRSVLGMLRLRTGDTAHPECKFLAQQLYDYLLMSRPWLAAVVQKDPGWLTRFYG